MRRVAALTLITAVICAGVMAGGEPAGASPVGLAQVISLSPTDGSPTACQLASVDLGPAGTVTPIGATFDIGRDGCPFDMAIGADGRLYGVLSFGETSTTPSVLVVIDPAAGTRTPVGSLGFATSLGGLAFDAGGTLWLYAQNADPACAGGTGQSCLYRLDPATGAATLVATGGANDVVIGATATCDALLGDELVDDPNGPPVSQLATLNTTSAALGPAPNPYGANLVMLGLEVDDSGVLRGLGAFSGPDGPTAPATYTVDAATGVATKVADVTLAAGQILAALAIAPLNCGSVNPISARFTG